MYNNLKYKTSHLQPQEETFFLHISTSCFMAKWTNNENLLDDEIMYSSKYQIEI